jgi:DNA-binding protein H-NS
MNPAKGIAMSNYTELMQEIENLERALSLAKKKADQAKLEHHQENVAKVLNLMNSTGVTIEDLKNPPKIKIARQKKGTMPPLFRSLVDPNLTWAGKGPKPSWYVTFVENGGDPKKLLIANQ